MSKVTITDGEHTFDVEFTEKEVIIRQTDKTLATINLAAAAASLVNQFIYDEP